MTVHGGLYWLPLAQLQVASLALKLLVLFRAPGCRRVRDSYNKVISALVVSDFCPLTDG